MTRNTYIFWQDVFGELEEIELQLRHNCILNEAIDRRHWVAERIRQLGRDMEPPTEPVIHEAKEE